MHNKNDKHQTVLVCFDGLNIATYPYCCWHKRGENITNLVNKAFSWISDKSKKKMNKFQKHFNVSDHGDGAYSTCSEIYDDRMIPCFSFDHWKECKIEDYEICCDQIKKNANKIHKINKLLWIGQVSHPTRRLLIDKFNDKSKMHIIGLKDHWGHNPEYKGPYISLPEHCDYKYLLDLQGNGYSARAKFLMFTKRPLFYQNRKFHEYWFWDLVPFFHYIPINEDLSNLNEMINWAEKNEDQVNIIANNAYKYACENLTKEKAISRLKQILYKLGTGEYN